MTQTQQRNINRGPTGKTLDIKAVRIEMSDR
jgi:hypothetical protein